MATRSARNTRNSGTKSTRTVFLCHITGPMDIDVADLVDLIIDTINEEL